MKKLIFCLLLSTAVVISDSLFAMDKPEKPPLPPRKSKQIRQTQDSIDNKTDLPVLETAVKEEVKGSKFVKLWLVDNKDESIKTFLSLSPEVIIQILDYTANHPIINNPEAIYANGNQPQKNISVFYSFRQTCKSWKDIVTPLIPQLFISSHSYGTQAKFSLLYPSFISILNLDLSNGEICQHVSNSPNLYENVVFLDLHTRDPNSLRSKQFCNRSVDSLELLLKAYAQKVKYLEISDRLNEEGAEVLISYLPSLKNLEMLKLSWVSLKDQTRHAEIIKALPESIKKICFTHGFASDLPVITEILRKRPHLNTIILESPQSIKYGSRAQDNNSLLATPNYKETSSAVSIMNATEDSLGEFNKVVKAHSNYEIFTYCVR